MVYQRSTGNFRVHNRLLQQHISRFFPYGKGDCTKRRLRVNPTLADYFRHLMRLDPAHGFVTHHSLTFMCTHMLRRHAALNTVNAFAKRCAQDLSMTEQKRALLEGDEKVLNKLLYFVASIPATRQNLRYKTHQSISFTWWQRLSSDDKAMCGWVVLDGHGHPACLFT